MQIHVTTTAEAIDRLAARHAAAVLVQAIAAHGRARLVAATGRSQLGLLDALVGTPGIEWSRVELFHLDEYLGVPADHPAGFSRYMTDRLIARTGITHHHLIDGMRPPEVVILELTRALRAAPIDLALTGIGENGHLAFNEPPADFTTTDAFMVVALDDTSRRQQVGEGWFTRLDEVPTHAITMTIPAILEAREIVCLAHGARKARAVAACFNTPPTPLAPASVLAGHPVATLYLDQDAASRLEPPVKAEP